MTDEFIKNPTHLIRTRLGMHDSESFEAGRMAMAFEIISVIRVLEGNPILNSSHSSAVVSVLETLIVSQGLQQAYELYDSLSASRRPTFVPEPSPSASADVGEWDQVPQSDEFVFSDEDPGVGWPLVERLRELAEAHRNQDEESNAELSESFDAEADEKPSE